MFLSEIPKAFRSGLINIDVALITVSPPDKYGNCTLGVSCDIAKPAIEQAGVIIAEVNSTMPQVWGSSVFHISKIDAFILVNKQ